MKDLTHLRIARTLQNLNKTIESKLWYKSEHSGLVLLNPTKISEIFPESQRYSEAKLSEEFTKKYGFPVYSRISKSAHYEERLGFLCNHGCYIGMPLIDINLNALKIVDKNITSLYFKCPIDGADLREVYNTLFKQQETRQI